MRRSLAARLRLACVEVRSNDGARAKNAKPGDGLASCGTIGVQETVESPPRSAGRPRLPFKVDFHLLIVGCSDAEPMLPHVALARSVMAVAGFLPLLQNFSDCEPAGFPREALRKSRFSLRHRRCGERRPLRTDRFANKGLSHRSILFHLLIMTGPAIRHNSLHWSSCFLACGTWFRRAHVPGLQVHCFDRFPSCSLRH